MDGRTGAPQDWTGLAGACVGALASLVPVALYQFGAIAHLPDPPGRVFDSEKIVTSRSAHILGLPDSVPGLASYGVTLGLILAARRRPGLRGVLAAKLAGDGAIAATKAVRQVAVFGQVCSWCLLTTACTAGMVFAGRRLIAEKAACAASQARRLTERLMPEDDEGAEPVLDALSPHS
jgi:uncharacterized membrane protein